MFCLAFFQRNPLLRSDFSNTEWLFVLLGLRSAIHQALDGGKRMLAVRVHQENSIKCVCAVYVSWFGLIISFLLFRMVCSVRARWILYTRFLLLLILSICHCQFHFHSQFDCLCSQTPPCTVQHITLILPRFLAFVVCCCCALADLSDPRPPHYTAASPSLPFFGSAAISLCPDRISSHPHECVFVCVCFWMQDDERARTRSFLNSHVRRAMLLFALFGCTHSARALTLLKLHYKFINSSNPASHFYFLFSFGLVRCLPLHDVCTSWMPYLLLSRQKRPQNWSSAALAAAEWAGPRTTASVWARARARACCLAYLSLCCVVCTSPFHRSFRCFFFRFFFCLCTFPLGRYLP